ncbi:PEP-CTERM sorting domain-containing protein [Verrucomicrobium sp. BvORR106]|uniref:PEP-CTERM sorting domain-containing protein n=1 Tax=Verrucomicrobium sp. BvORR106 TaxID=1403819 RepID=UPI00056E1BBD|nr:PEP-CTERM sorting domain-containing protein [Verrucomicrobium sp. BvORR106]
MRFPFNFSLRALFPRAGWAFLAGLALHATATSASAILVAYDSFDYTVGSSLATLNGGAGFSSAWSIQQTTTGGDGTVLVSTSGITSTPSHPTTSTAGNGIYGVRSFDRISSGTVYFSFLVDNVNDGSRFIAISLMDGSSEKAYLGQSGAGSLWGAFGALNLNSTTASRPTVSGMTQLVLKVEFDQSGINDRATLFVNPDLFGAEPTSGYFTSTGDYFANGFNGIRMGSGFANGSQTTTVASFDEVRIATDWVSLAQTPEPGRMLLVVCGLAGVVMRRRRRRK